MLLRNTGYCNNSQPICNLLAELRITYSMSTLLNMPWLSAEHADQDMESHWRHGVEDQPVRLTTVTSFSIQLKSSLTCKRSVYSVNQFNVSEQIQVDIRCALVHPNGQQFVDHWSKRNKVYQSLNSTEYIGRITITENSGCLLLVS